MPQRPVKVKKSGLLSRRKPSNSYRRSRSRGSPRSWLRMALVTLGLLGLAGLCLALVVFYHQLLTSSYFCIKDIKNIEIEGARSLTPEVILKLADLGPDTNLLAIRPGRVERALLAHPWISGAELTRKWPHRIHLVLRHQRLRRLPGHLLATSRCEVGGRRTGR